jgi:hypothetical protein
MRSSLIFPAILVGVGCYGEPLESDIAEGSGGSGGSVEQVAQSGPTSTSSGIQSDDPEEEFDPCPEVTYVLWEAEGVRYVVTMEVFCEPVQNLNLGCPPPPIVKN